LKDSSSDKIISIHGFFASKEPDLCAIFTQGHIQVLEQHGFMHFKSYDSYWYNLEDSYVLLAMQDGIAVGGIRLELKVKERLLPFEKVLHTSFPAVTSLITDLNLIKAAEPCSLWNSKLVSGKNLSIYLSRASIAMSHLLGIKNIISFNATYTFRIPLDVGCHMIESIGDNGYFNYPTEQFRAALWLNSKLRTLETANEHSRTRMLSLRQYRNQTFEECYDNSIVKIRYDLQL
jgi:hypothetical protein